jgi:tryptophanyl-tRNA synthetase
VGEDQLPMIEQTNEIVRTFNRTYNCNVLKECKALVPKAARLAGIDGKAKMSKSLGNAIYLSDPIDVVAKKVRSMYTDPNHLRVTDPGKIEGNVVFEYLDIFDADTKKVQELKDHYQRGGLGDMTVKNYLLEVLEQFLAPVRIKRAEFAQDPHAVMNMLKAGTEHTAEVAEQTLKEVKEVMHLVYY